MNLPKLDYNKIVSHFTLGLDVLFVLFVLASYFGGVAGAWSEIVGYVFYFVVAVNTLFFALKIKAIPEKERGDSKMIYYFSHFFLLSLVVIVVNQFLKRAWIIDNLNYITAVSIAFGFLTFYAYRNKVEREIEDESKNEEKAEKKRFKEFGGKFPRINKIWGLRGIVRWMYVLGWKFSVPLVLITGVFIAIKIGMPLIFNVSYIDEYFHLFSGIDFFKTGNFSIFYNDGLNYNRGSYVSFLVGLFMFVFGKTIFVAKMVPAIMGTINFFLLYFIAKQFIKRKRYILLLMLVYTFSPWIIFNHFYIRMYVFYEFFLLILTFCFFKIKDGEKIKLNTLIYPMIIFIVCLVTYFLSYDYGAHIIFFLGGAYLTYSYIFELEFNKKFKTVFFILSVIFIFVVMDPLNKIWALFHASKTYTSPENLKYCYYFFNLGLIFSIFFFFSFFQLTKLKLKKIIFMLVAFIIFLIHLLSSKDLQILRAILYFLPMFYLVSIIGFSRLKMFKKLNILIVVLMFFSLIFSFPSGFLNNGPHIEGEIKNIDYSSAYAFVGDNCNNKVYALHHHAYISLFYLEQTPYVNYLDMSIINKGMPIYQESKNNVWQTVYGNILVINNRNLIKNLITKKEKVCIVIRSDSKHNFRYITSKDKQLLDSYFKVKNFEEINVYYN